MKGMPRLLSSLALVLALCPWLFAAGELSNRPAPEFRLQDAKGSTVSLADYKGKVILIEFMSTTCPHCQKLAPALEAVHAKFKGRVGVLGIATHTDNASTVTEFAQTYKVSYPILLDPTHSTALGYLKPAPPNYSFSIPHLFVVDQSGYIRDDFTENPSNSEFFTAEGLSRLVGAYLARR